MRFTFRWKKGSALTHKELDDNFKCLDRGFQPTEVDTTDATYFYFSEAVDEGWTIRRQNRATGALEFASGTNDFNTAWDNRTILTYS